MPMGRATHHDVGQRIAIRIGAGQGYCLRGILVSCDLLIGGERPAIHAINRDAYRGWNGIERAVVGAKTETVRSVIAFSRRISEIGSNAGDGSVGGLSDDREGQGIRVDIIACKRYRG